MKIQIFAHKQLSFTGIGSIHKVRTHRGGGGSPQKRTGAYSGGGGHIKSVRTISHFFLRILLDISN